GGVGEKVELGLVEGGMDKRLESSQRRAVTQNARSELVAIDLSARGGAGKCRLDRRRGFPFIEPMHDGIGVVHRHALLGEKARRHRLSHAQRAGQTENEHAASNNPKSAASHAASHPSCRRYCSSATSGRPRITKCSPSMRSNSWMPIRSSW